jgi:Inositol monophosphatase family
MPPVPWVGTPLVSKSLQCEVYSPSVSSLHCGVGSDLARPFVQTVRTLSTMAPTAEDTAAYLALAKRVAVEAGAMITEALKTSQVGYDRKTKTDPVTETDRAVEAYIFSQVRAAYPTHSFIGEESAPDEQWTDAPTWICDPIDVHFAPNSQPRGKFLRNPLVPRRNFTSTPSEARILTLPLLLPPPLRTTHPNRARPTLCTAIPTSASPLG